jgi:hypothetical protein
MREEGLKMEALESKAQLHIGTWHNTCHVDGTLVSKCIDKKEEKE